MSLSAMYYVQAHLITIGGNRQAHLAILKVQA